LKKDKLFLKKLLSLLKMSLDFLIEDYPLMFHESTSMLNGSNTM